MATITLKASFQGTNRRFPIPETLTFSALYELLYERFSCDTPFIVTYQDSDNDVITVSRDDELIDLITTAKRDLQPVRIQMFTQHEIEARATAPESPLPPQPNLKQVPHLEQLLSGLNELLSTINQTISDLATPANRSASRGFSRNVLSPDNKENQDIRHGRRGLWFVLRKYMAFYPSGRQALRRELASVSPQVKAEFKQLVRYIRKSGNREDIISALKEAFPLLRGWASDEMDDIDVPVAGQIDSLVEAVEPALVPKAGKEATEKITAFIKLALTDQRVLSIIRKMGEMGPMPWEEN
eukprot:GFKZ01005381.1.p1 GENE.GFKZ01005381.1~~GFKZ01005381.1.p1  ORF type:complete len:318 (-),score=31.98 GFKZ01005381.1:1121-2014(-)